MFFVSTDLLGFGAVNAFLRYLTTGVWLDFSAESFRSALATPLTQLMVEPLSIFAHPWMTAVAGLLIAAIVFVPVMVAVLYRLWVCVLFLLVVAAVGHLPVLAGFLAAGCILAGRTRLRSDFPFLALLVGLAPLAVYLGFFAQSAEIVLVPLGWFVLYMALILAVAVAMVAGGVVLALARLTRFRPGVIWPVLLVFLALPVWLFYEKVGPAELEYALLARGLERSDALFRAESLGSYLRSHPELSSSAARSAEAMLEAAQRDLARRRAALDRRCQSFLQRHPASRDVPSAMWVRAVLPDVRVDPRAFGDGLVKYHGIGPTKLSLGDWSALAQHARYGGSPQALIAHQRLGIDALRDGRLQKALEDLHIAERLARFVGDRPARGGESIWAGVFAPAEPLPGLEYYREALVQTREILWLMDENKVAEGLQANVDAFADYMKLWPFEQLSPHGMAALAASSRNTELEDNYALLEALAEKDDLQRAAKLAVLTTGVKDAAIIAHYELGRLALRHGASPEWSARQLKTAEYYFGVVQRARDNPYKPSAEQHLAWLAASRPAAS